LVYFFSFWYVLSKNNLATLALSDANKSAAGVALLQAG
jgi:hypothetical protein